MKMTMVEIKARHMYRTILFGTLYEIGRCEPAEDFLRIIGLLEEYEPEVSRDEDGEDSSEEQSESSINSLECSYFSLA